MEIAKQLAVFLDNRPGTLARVCDALGQYQGSLAWLGSPQQLRLYRTKPSASTWFRRVSERAWP